MKSGRATGATARMFGIGLLAAGVVLAAPTAAFAAGTGYTPGAAAPGGAATGLPGNVVSTTTIQPSGGTANATVGSTSIAASVPAGAFTGPVQLVMTDASSSAVAAAGGASTVVTFGVGFYVNGTKVTGTFPAVTITVSSPSITAGSTVYLVTASGLQAVSGASVKAGSATFTITSDPVDRESRHSGGRLRDGNRGGDHRGDHRTDRKALLPRGPDRRRAVRTRNPAPGRAARASAHRLSRC